MYNYGTITLYGLLFQKSSSWLRKIQRRPHHISILFLIRIQFALRCVQSPLLTASQLVSFPTGTKTFQFPVFATPKGSIAKSHSEILGSKAACTSPRLIAACHVLHRISSQAIHLLTLVYNRVFLWKTLVWFFLVSYLVVYSFVRVH